MKIKYLNFILLFFTFFPLSSYGQDHLEGVPVLSANHPLLAEATLSANEAHEFYSYGSYPAWAYFAGKAMFLLKEAYGCYPFNHYTYQPLWEYDRKDGKMLRDIMVNVFGINFWSNKSFDVKYWLFEGVDNKEAKALWNEEVKKTPYPFTLEQLVDFYITHPFEPKDKMEMELWMIHNHTDEQRLKAKTKLPRLIQLIEQRDGTASSRRTLTLSVLASIYAQDKEWEKAEQLFKQAADSYRQSGNDIGYKLSKLSQCEQIASRAVALTRGIDRDWKEAIRQKEREYGIMRSFIGEKDILTRWTAMERTLFLEKKIVVERWENASDDAFSKGIELYKAGDYGAAAEAFRLCDSLDRGIKRYDKSNEYDRQWLMHCYLQLGKIKKAYHTGSYNDIQPPIDRRLTSAMDDLVLHEPKTEKRQERLLELARTAFGENSPEFAHILTDVAEDYLYFRKYVKAHANLSEALNIYARKLGTKSLAYAYAKWQLSYLYDLCGKHQAAFKANKEAMDIFESILGKNNYYSNNILNYLIKKSKDLGLHNEAGRLLQEKYEIHDYDSNKDKYNLLKDWAKETYLQEDTIDGKSPAERAIIVLEKAIEEIHSLSDISHRLYVLELAKYHFRAALDSTYATIFENRDSSTVNHTSQHKKKAVQLIQQLIDNYFTTTFEKAYYEGILATNYYSDGAYDLALEATERMQELNHEYKNEILTKDDPNIDIPDFLPYNHLIELYYNKFDHTIAVIRAKSFIKLGLLSEATQTLQWPLACIREFHEEIQEGEVFNKQYMRNLNLSDYIQTLKIHADIMQKEERPMDAAQDMIEIYKIMTPWVLSRLILKTDQDREKFRNRYNVFYEQTLPQFAIRNKQDAVLECLYDACLLSKGLLLSIETEITQLFKESGESQEKEMYTKLQQDRLLLTNQMELPKRLRTVNVDSLSTSISSHEHEMSLFLRQANNNLVTNLLTSWHQVEQQLGEHECAIEFLAIPISADSTVYAALSIRKGYQVPHMTTLFEQHQLQALTNSDIYNSDALYRILWQPLEKELNNADTIYFSPAGVLHQVAIEYLPGMERRQTFRLSSTRELVHPNNKATRTINAALFGGIQYELTEEERSALQQQSSTTFRDVPDLRDFRGASRKLPLLKGSRQEVADISAMMNQQHIPNLTMIGKDGTEESFKALSGERKTIIHISTHGFYQKNTEVLLNTNDDTTEEDDNKTYEDNALSRSGLLMAGASDFLNGDMDDFFCEDGILTAKEISRLDLNGLNLVVLSACETGLGDVTSEGVYGLQRAFKKAGAKTLMMSLWKVEDEATGIMMTEFYRQLLEGKTKQDAFIEARRHLRHFGNGRFNRWECWAAFVMLDGKE